MLTAQAVFLLVQGQTNEQTNRQTNGQTDTQTRLNALPMPAAITPAWAITFIKISCIFRKSVKATLCMNIQVVVWINLPEVQLLHYTTVAHTQRDSPGGSTWRSQCKFPSEHYEDGHTCLTTGCCELSHSNSYFCTSGTLLVLGD